MNADAGRYTRITHRLAAGVSSDEDEASQALAAVLERRIVESIAIECAPHVTSGLLSERLAQAVTALSMHGVLLCAGDGAVTIERCFCESEACGHAGELLGRLLGVAIESIITHESRYVLRPVGAVDAAVYTARASITASKLRS